MSEPTVTDIAERLEMMLDVPPSLVAKVEAGLRSEPSLKLQTELSPACQWAADVWRCWYLSMTSRRGSRHRIDDEPAFAVMTDLACRFLRDPVRAVRYCKNQILYLTGWAFGLRGKDLPTVSDLGENQHPGILGGGWVRQFCKHLMSGPRGGASDHASFFSRTVDVLMSKTGMPAVSEAFIEGALEGYKQAMTQGRPVDGSSDQCEYVRLIAERLASVAFEGAIFCPLDCIPSLNASLNGPRRTGGCAGDLMSSFWDRIQIQSWDDPVMAPTVIHTTVGCPGLFADREVPHSVSVPVLGLDLLQAFQDHVDSLVLEHLAPHGQPSDRSLRADLEAALRGSMWVPGLDEGLISGKGLRLAELGQILDRWASPFVDARPSPIPEPNKVRVITLQEAAVSFRSLEMQKFLHGTLRRLSPLEFIGHPIDLEGWSRHFIMPLKENEIFVSGDYKSSTDELKPGLSLAIMDAICKVARYRNREGKLESLWGTIWHRLARWDLCGHAFQLPDGSWMRQVWGQLMGSPTSFPVLCLANLATYAAAMGLVDDVSLRRLLHEDSPIVVNGDDLGAVMTETVYSGWCTCARSVGLSPSAGKNYTSREFIIMNSGLRVPSGVDPEGKIKWRDLGYLNQSLLLGLEKKGLDAGKDIRSDLAWWDLGPRARELVQSVPDAVADRWLHAFIARHRTILDQCPPGVSWNASELLGGAGLPAMSGEDPYIPEGCRKTAALISCLDPLKRRKLLAFPPREKMTQLGQILRAAEDYYSRYFQVVESDRDPMEILLDNWGISDFRKSIDASSPLGSSLRLGFLLWGYCACRLGEGPDRFPPMWVGVDPVLSGFLNPRPRKARSLLIKEKAQALKRLAVTALKTVVGDDDPSRSRLHPMDPSKTMAWHDPQDLLIQWQISVPHTVRFGSSCHHDELQARVFSSTPLTPLHQLPELRDKEFWFANRRRIMFWGGDDYQCLDRLLSVKDQIARAPAWRPITPSERPVPLMGPGWGLPEGVLSLNQNCLRCALRAGQHRVATKDD